MKFPFRELEVVQLAHDMSRGLTEHPEAFPAPPAAADAIAEAIAAYTTARESSVTAQAAARSATKSKRQAFASLADLLKSNLKYAESMARDDSSRLHLVGWGSPRKPEPRAEPGQVLDLRVRREGPGWVSFEWKAPVFGGPVTAYRIQRRKRDSGDWVDAGTAIIPAVRLDGQPAGIELEYRVIGVNAAGEGLASNSVRVVL